MDKKARPLIIYVLLGLVSSALCAAGQMRDVVGPGGDKVVVHLFEWSWKDVEKECENLSKWGYWGVQVSPPQEDVQGNEWWTRYQPVSYKLTSRSGTEQEFAQMVETCKKHGVSIIVDAVINHMANQPGGTGRGGTNFDKKCNYPGLYGCQDFHHYNVPCEGGSCCGRCDNCEKLQCDGNNPEKIYDCNLSGLPDLDQSKGWVQEKIAEYFNHLIDLGVAGIRIDASKHIEPGQLSAILKKLKNPGLFVNQEVILQGGEDCNCLRNENYYGNGKVWEFKTPLVFYDVFSKDNNMEKIRDMDSNNPGGWGCGWAKSELAMTFVVNHDRLVDSPSRANTITMFNEGRYRLALITLLAHPYGQPNILSSYNFDYKTYDENKFAPVRNTADKTSSLLSPFDGNCGYWKDRPMKPYACEHRWPEVRNMVQWRNVAGLSGTLFFDVWNKNVLLITRGNANSPGKAFVAVNNGAAYFSQEVATKGMPAGTYCNVVTTASNGGASVDDCYPCKASCPDKVTVGSDGKVQVKLPGYNALAFHTGAMVPSPSATV